MTATRLCACCSALCLALSAQTEPPQADSKRDKQTRKQEQQFRKELQGPYYIWVTRDVAYIITDDELRAFRQLQNDEEREQFVEQFWLRRDPTPDTEENEFKEEHYRRIAYANERFASGVEGWRTERGRTYIVYGPPDEIESHPSGGSYTRSADQGGGTITAYPFEVWRYRYLDGVGTNVEIMFVDPTLTGEYRMALDPEELNALAHVTPPPQNQNGTPASSNSNEFDRLERWALLHKPPPTRFPDLEALAQVNSTVRFNNLPMQIRTDYFRAGALTVLIPVTIQFENRDLHFQPRDGAQRATVNLYMRITSLTRRVMTVQEDVLTVDSLAARHSLYQRLFYLPPGMYRLNVVAKDAIGGNIGTYDMALHVPAFEGKLSASSVVLADLIEKMPARSIAAGQFVLGDSKVRPRMDGVFSRDEKMGIFFEVYGAGDAPDISVEYLVSKAGSEKPLIDFTEELSTPRLRVEKMLPLAQLDQGEYILKAVVTDKNSGRAITPSAAFSVR